MAAVTDKTKKLGTLRKRSEFLFVRDGFFAAKGAVVVQMRARTPEDTAPPRQGFTATKKIGNAVTRNRAKRRLREAARALLPELGLPGHDYVFIARGAHKGAATTAREFTALLDDVRKALITLSRRADTSGTGNTTKKTT
jgi:ribonuclease P protein component